MKSSEREARFKGYTVLKKCLLRIEKMVKPTLVIWMHGHLVFTAKKKASRKHPGGREELSGLQLPGGPGRCGAASGNELDNPGNDAPGGGDVPGRTWKRDNQKQPTAVGTQLVGTSKEPC